MFAVSSPVGYSQVIIMAIISMLTMNFSTGISMATTTKTPDRVCPVRAGSMNEQDLKKAAVQFFSDKDLDKYRINKLYITEQCLRSVLPVGAGIALIFVSGPVACIPIAVGIGHGIKAYRDSIKRKKIKKLITGGLLFLKGDTAPSGSMEQKCIQSFSKFYTDTLPGLREAFATDATDHALKAYLASRLLILNRFGFLISNRFNFDPDVRDLVKKPVRAHPAGKYSRSFLKKHIVPLIIATEKILSECPAEKLETLAFGKPR